MAFNETLVKYIDGGEWSFPVKADAVLSEGDIAAVVDGEGLAVPFSAGTDRLVLGIVTRSVDATGKADGEMSVRIRKGRVVLLATGAGADEVLSPDHIGKAVYGIDAKTIAIVATGRSKVGTFLGKDERGRFIVNINDGAL